MAIEKFSQLLEQLDEKATSTLEQAETFTPFAVILVIYVIAFLLANRLRKYAPILDAHYGGESAHPLPRLAGKYCKMSESPMKRNLVNIQYHCNINFVLIEQQSL